MLAARMYAAPSWVLTCWQARLSKHQLQDSEIESQLTLSWLEKADKKAELTLTKPRVMVEEGDEEVGKGIHRATLP